MGAETLLREMGILDSFQSFVLVLGLIMGRMLPILIMNPFLGGKIMPQNVKVGFTILIAALVYKPITASLVQPIPQDTLPYMALLLKEILFGASIGYISSLVFFAIQSGGRILDLSRGASMANMLAPQTEDQVSYFGELQFQMSIVLFFVLGGHHLFFRAIFQSFQLVPLETFPDFVTRTVPSAQHLAHVSGQVFLIGLLLAAPVTVATFLTDWVFGIINRVSPQINVFFLAMPTKMMVGLVVALFVLGFLAEQMGSFFVTMLRDVNRWIRMF
ncbi:MAG TPA: flagellar biosynthetic protein FliR [Acidobacteriota bacterium]|nr:flagellar biosynthetic protein FliR [Acidobacteriota bacterium]HQM62895.1 flagellar biosynthetic protein FliR [Acidobacteriota bacterium]